jgi:hypothetical protein
MWFIYLQLNFKALNKPGTFPCFKTQGKETVNNTKVKCGNSIMYSYNKANKCTISQLYFGKELFMFRTDLLSIIRSLNTVFTAIGICHTSYVDCLLARSGWKLRNSASCWFFYKNIPRCTVLWMSNYVTYSSLPHYEFNRVFKYPF